MSVEDGYTISDIVNSCFCFKTNHQVHPSDPTGPKHSEFLNVDGGKTVRVIHVKPDSQNVPRISYGYDKRLSISRHSLTEEYWFTRWTKPLRGTSCNCSFRRSLRCSFNPVSNESMQNNVPVSKIVNVETFVERLIQETYFEALQEFLMKIDNFGNRYDKGGVDNLAFNKSIDDTDGVILRHKNYIDKQPAILSVECTNKNEKNQILEVQNSDKSCTHKNNNKSKPLVMLLHGIGSTADVWWNIIYKLKSNGFEIIAPDMLGHGYSMAPNQIGAYKFKNLLKYSLEVFDHYAVDDSKVIVIGHSFGCSIATAMARYRTQQVVQLVMISGGGPTPLAAPTDPYGQPYLDCGALIKPFIYCGLKRSFFYASRGKFFTPCETTHGIPWYVLKYIEKGQNWPEGDAAFHRRILIPTLLVHGLKDTKVTLVQECEMERTIPRAFLELIPNAGHMSMLDTPEHLSHMITCFLDWWGR